MTRRLYIWLLKMHPQAFRARFGDEMLSIFDESLEKRVLLTDAALSLFRQSALRSQQPPFSRTAAADGVPLFYSAEPEVPTAAALARGALVALASFALFSVAMSHRWAQGTWIIGSHHPSPSHILGAHTDAKAGADLPAEVKMQPYPARAPVSAYFRLMRVLSVLDTDQDNVISAAELQNAPAALRTLDRNHDGFLSAEECGLKLASDLSPDQAGRTRLAFMRVHPVLAALDANRDGLISEDEMRNAARALRSLDANRDGKLTEREVLPDPAVILASNMMLLLDRNGDGRIEREERIGPIAERFRAALNRAEKGGTVTEDDLVLALRQ